MADLRIKHDSRIYMIGRECGDMTFEHKGGIEYRGGIQTGSIQRT